MSIESQNNNHISATVIYIYIYYNWCVFTTDQLHISGIYPSNHYALWWTRRPIVNKICTCVQRSRLLFAGHFLTTKDHLLSAGQGRKQNTVNTLYLYSFISVSKLSWHFNVNPKFNLFEWLLNQLVYMWSAVLFAS